MIFDTIYRAIFFYFLIMVIIRVLGKREVGELSIADLIVLLIIADIAVVSIENTKVPMYIYISAILTISIVQKIISFLSLKFNFVRFLVDGKPSMIMVNGKLNINEMKKQKYTVDDLISQTRDKDIASLHDISYAILETSGDLSVFKKGTKKPLPVIVSGEIVKENLAKYNRDESWINEQLNKKNLKLKDVYYADITKDTLSILKGFE
ncbi:DUF421 domain-containing protein [Mycoplasmatota bacterium WC44]